MKIQEKLELKTVFVYVFQLHVQQDEDPSPIIL